ncbi:MAG: pol sigma70 protein [Patescibacteria group bacterium]|nr:pol sigma70 protein [Patescibacteria group bacterium]
MRGKKVRVEVSSCDNLILESMEKMGIKTVAELCRRAGIPKQESHVGKIINTQAVPYTLSRQGTPRWRPYVKKIAAVLRLPPESLFSEEQLDAPFEWNKAHLEEESEKVRAMLVAGEHYALPDVLLERKELVKVIKAQLKQLRPVEARVLQLHYGLDGVEGQTLESIGKILVPPRTRARVHQIEARAIKKLRMPHHAEPLKEAGALQHCG